MTSVSLSVTSFFRSFTFFTQDSRKMYSLWNMREVKSPGVRYGGRRSKLQTSTYRQELFSTDSNAVRIIYLDVVHTPLPLWIRRHTRECNSSRVVHITLPQLRNYKCSFIYINLVILECYLLILCSEPLCSSTIRKCQSTPFDPSYRQTNTHTCSRYDALNSHFRKSWFCNKGM
jgi:hypothetical protein